jgi:FkbM family methyltransferase
MPNNQTDVCYEWVNTELYSAKQVIEACANTRIMVHGGANVGSYARQFAQQFQQVYAFEPELTNFRCLVLNTMECDNVCTVRAALSHQAGTVGLDNQHTNNSGTFFVDGAGLIPQMTVDSLQLDHVDCLHFDMEGHEFWAIIGAVQTIKRCRPLIVVEWLDHGQKQGWSKNSLIDYLSFLGYKNMKPTGSDMMFRP